MDFIAAEHMIRIGTVSSINAGERTATVILHDYGDTVSGDLRVMQHFGCAVDVPIADAHTHPKTTATFWMPVVGDTVVCIYPPVFNGGGVILGVLK